MAFRFRSFSEPSIFSLMAPNFDLVEFVIFPGRDDVMVQKYTLKLAGGRSWYAPDGRPSHPSTEKARAIWQELRTLGYRPRAEYNGLNSLQSVMEKFDKMRAKTTAEQWHVLNDVPCISDFINEISKLEDILDKL